MNRFSRFTPTKNLNRRHPFMPTLWWLSLSVMICFQIKTHQLNAQSPAWLQSQYRKATYPSESFLVVVDSIKIGRFRSTQQEDIEGLRKKLYEKMAQQISTQVSSNTKQEVRQEGTAGKEQLFVSFQSSTEIKTEVRLTAHYTDHYRQRKPSQLKGILVVDREALAKSLLSVARQQLKGLVNRMEVYASENRVVEPSELESDFNAIDQGRNVAFQLRPIQDEDYSVYLNKYNRLLASIKSSENQRNYEAYLQAAKMEYERGNFNQAYGMLQKLRLLRTKNQTVQELLESVKRDYTQDVVRELNRNISTGNYHLGLQLANEFSLQINDQQVNQLKAQLRQKQFDKTDIAIQLDLSKSDLRAAKLKFKQLENFADVNPSRYNTLSDAILQLETRLERQQVEISYAQSNYLQAWQTLNRLENRYGRIDEFKKIRKKTAFQLYKKDLKELKMTRPKRYSIQLGIESMTDPQEELGNIDYDNPFSLAYSFGLYRKFNITERIRASGYDRSLSDFVGVKYRVIDHGNRFAWNADSIPQIGGEERFVSEIGLDMVLINIFHLEGGMRMSDLMPSLNPDFYYASLGLHIPIEMFAVRMGLRYEFDTDQYQSFAVQAALLLRFDFRRQIRKKDKKGIRMKYGI
ncbi:MAG: hypothetical protein LAT68_00560 [Cyclobacteriaceae bacterium]|nr:hypothetical protein [Cyclobacteriaceae bacterium]MCH8514794.1 hypothetical protein [Cyclobacteriaceae bacterium]